MKNAEDDGIDEIFEESLRSDLQAWKKCGTTNKILQKANEDAKQQWADSSRRIVGILHQKFKVPLHLLPNYRTDFPSPMKEKLKTNDKKRALPEEGGHMGTGIIRQYMKIHRYDKGIRLVVTSFR